MIIKSMSRKEASYSQLYDYMKHGANEKDNKYRYVHNCYGDKRDDILVDFNEHGKQLKQRKNGVYLYHEIISISRSKKLSQEKQKEALYDIVNQYVQQRAPKQLACGYMHDDDEKNNLHFHLMLSSNEAGTSKKVSLKKEEFSDIKQNLEKWVLEKYPELEQKKLISKENTYKNDKGDFVDTLQSVFSTAKSMNEFHELLRENKASYKIRGNTVTFINEKTKKRHRVKTLGLLDEYEKMHQGFTQTKKKEKVKKSVTNAAKEWAFGDFEEREKRIKKEKFKAQNKKDATVKKQADQNFKEKTQETVDEWVFGDFSARESRKRNEASEQRLKQWRENKAKAKSHEKGKKM